ncbi:MAG TPA: radical SAM protein [Candidatus Margulisiibacteriota bacterium]|nr:radical SAM protein [Candidatus Margulisiibacteriota bacterium]
MQTGSYVTRIPTDKGSLWKNSKPLLVKLDIELTERCNNNCAHCCINLPLDNQEAAKNELSTAEIKNILKEAVSLGCVTVRFTGGEPLLKEDFEELYLFSRKLGLRVFIFTNATLITPHLVDLFCRIPPLERIEISVYGMKKSSYEGVSRVSGSFEAAWRGISLLAKRRVPFVVKGALLPANKDEIEKFEKWSATIPWMDKSPQYSMFFDLRCRRDSMDKNRQIKKLRLSAEDCLKILVRRKEYYIRVMQEFCAKFMHPSGDNLFSCGSGHGVCVDAYGKIQPCLALRHPDCVYDLKKVSLKEALINYFPKMREMKPENPDYLSRCAKCFLRGLCEQCPAKSWMEYGTLDTPVEYLCECAHAQARYLGLIEEEEKAWKVDNWKERIRRFCEKEAPYHENEN